ncbi:hypothetical protein [Flexivirga oryzae]|uniref:Uncharacterized protein n=1 Tax=Flexivirga oryzae TaxID=1794944 RepID=A0A839N9Z0_9MICO|nr:hypothetical protein [Flexivirga oryzae]MBB2892025.1 hypothetical protein [Flexivirga oryzae]
MNAAEQLPVDATWAPADACTLPTAQRPLRVAEFDGLFAKSLHDVEQPRRTRARLLLEGSLDLPTQVQDLITGETSCCSFFNFTATSTTDPDAHTARVVLDVEVPAERADVLAGLVDRARAQANP